jgi:hypothetical protein
MTELISQYIDLFAFVRNVIVLGFVAYKIKRKAGIQVRAIPLYLFVFGPSAF